MTLLHLLRCRVVGLLLRQLLMFLVLLLLEFLPFLLLFPYQLVLLLLIFLVPVCVSCVGSSRMLDSRQVAGMNHWSSAGVLRTTARCSASHDSIALKITGFRGCNDSRLAMVERCALLWIGARSLHVRGLVGDGADVSLMRSSIFLGSWASVYPAVAVVADVSVVRHIDSRVVHVVNHVDVHMIDGRVIEEMPTVPTSAQITAAEVPEAVIDPAIKTYGRAPIAIIEKKPGAAPAPVGRGPRCV